MAESQPEMLELRLDEVDVDIANVEALQGGIDPMLLTCGESVPGLASARWKVTATATAPLADVVDILAPAVSERARNVFARLASDVVEFGTALELETAPFKEDRPFYFMNVLDTQRGDAPVRLALVAPPALIISASVRDALVDAGCVGLTFIPCRDDGSRVPPSREVLDVVVCRSCGQRTMRIMRGNDEGTLVYQCDTCGLAFSGD